MKKTLALLSLFVCVLCALSGCARQVNYIDYISEKRSEIYVYQDDNVWIQIYCSQKERPYAADGIKGDVGDLVEVFVKLPKNPQELYLSVEGHEGEMNYRSVENGYYLSFTAPAFSKNAVEVTLTCDGKSDTYSALTVLYQGVMSCENAVLCAVEHASELFANLTKNGLFDAEIQVRLLYDDGCYYYVGVCDKQSHITAYLIDGEHGKVIVTKELDI